MIQARLSVGDRHTQATGLPQVESVQLPPSLDGCRPLGNDFGEHVETPADILAPFGVMRRRGIEGPRVLFPANLHHCVKFIDGETWRILAGTPSHFIHGEQPVVPVHRRIFDPLGSDRAGQLLPAKEELGPGGFGHRGAEQLRHVTDRAGLSTPCHGFGGGGTD